MARTKGALGKRTIAINEAVENCFRHVNKGGKYLDKLANMENPALFVTLLAKCIPQAVAVDVHHHAVDLGKAMMEAQERLNAIHGEVVTIEHVTAPDAEELLEQARHHQRREVVRVTGEYDAPDTRVTCTTETVE